MTAFLENRKEKTFVNRQYLYNLIVLFEPPNWYNREQFGGLFIANDEICSSL